MAGITRFTISAVAIAVVFGLGISPVAGQSIVRSERLRFEKLDFKVDHKIPMRDLLPPAPKSAPSGPWDGKDLARVPEVQFQEPLVINAERRGLVQTAHQIAKINYLNRRQRDLFMDVLIDHRPDLAGLPFVMGDECRLTKSDSAGFNHEVAVIGNCLNSKDTPMGFWREVEDYAKQRGKHKTAGEMERYRIAALMQMLGARSSDYQTGLPLRLAELSKWAKPEATQALARMAVFSMDEAGRKSAVVALQNLPAEHATSVLLKGLHYPWPTVARNSAEAMVQLKRTDLIPELIKMLETSDPRAPIMSERDGQKSPVVRELVRMNHHRNCLLCHPPANTPDVLKKDEWPDMKWSETAPGVLSNISGRMPSFDPDIVVAAMPTPGTAFRVSDYHFMSSPDIFVRADVTYLRQDFSLLHKVVDAAPWPEMQRFDYLVRTRVLTDSEARAYRQAFSGESPYRQLALDALRRLTGKNAGTSAAQWRSALGL